MPDEYKALVAALKETGIPFEEYGWKKRPEGAYGTITLDMEADSEEGDGEKLDRSWEASVDVFFSRLDDRKTMIKTVEDAIRSVCGSSWELNSTQYETQTRLFHVEWVCEVMGDFTGEPEAGDD